MSVDGPLLPGRLGDPELTLISDPRTDPRVVSVLAQLGIGGAMGPLPVLDTDPIESIHEVLAATESGLGALYDALFADLPEVSGVKSTTTTIRGVDGNDITLFIHEPIDRQGPVPAVVHLHSGAMVFATARDLNHVRWRDDLAATGLVVVGVEFRNGSGSLGNHPFPAGLNDCVSALRWVIDSAAELGSSHSVVLGESGGGNLSLAVALLAKRDGWVSSIAGVYAKCPFISGAYAAPPAELTSLHENGSYFMSASLMSLFVRAYDPDGDNASNPLAWPYLASLEDLRGLPPHVISVNELDPLRDEGIAYYRNLVRAEVNVSARTVLGTPHNGDCLFPAAMPNTYAAALGDINKFATSIPTQHHPR